jgi:predicted AlkP superfamily pyrophosphatase or phosphodiesterase
MLPAQADDASPRLVVHLTIDQLRPDYLDRWQGEFTGGLKRLLGEGVVYWQGEQDHASTETAPGHATLLSGRWPAHTGILSNNRGVPDPSHPLLEVTPGGYRVEGASPRGFVGTTLYDWMLAVDPDTRVLSVSYKDRGAILPIGRARVPVYWYADGRFTTSTWYADALPVWLRDWNARDIVGQLAGHEWRLVHPRGSYPERDDRPYENGGVDNAFPHIMPLDRQQGIRDIQYFPAFDSLTLDLALTGMHELGLGQRDGTDLLAVSLSITDKIGHRYGPGSLEMHDQILHLDRALGWFLDSLEARIGTDRLIVSLASDHGGQDFPADGMGGRIRLKTVTAALNRTIRTRWGISAMADEDRGLVFADVAALTARGIDVDSIRHVLAHTVRALPGVREVYTPASLARSGAHDAMMWNRLISDGTEWLIAVSLEQGWLWTDVPMITDHGTTNRLDVLIPIIIRAPGITPQRVARPVGAVDLAPTLAALLGVTPTEPLDGRPLAEVVSHPR